MLAENVPDGKTEKLGEHLVGEAAAQVLIPEHGHGRNVVGEQAQLLRAFTQGLFRPLALSDVAHGGDNHPAVAGVLGAAPEFDPYLPAIPAPPQHLDRFPAGTAGDDRIVNALQLLARYRQHPVRSQPLSLFLVELGAAMMVASTMVPPESFSPFACSNSPTLANRAAPMLCCSNR